MMRVRILGLIFLMFTLAPEVVAAEQPVPDPEQGRPTLGLVLAGGGARGAAHVGVLKVLEELGIRPDVIAGTSMGAIVGGMYASGLTVEEIEHVVNETDWTRLFTDEPARADRTMRSKQFDSDFLVRRRVGFNRGRLQLPLGVLQGQRLDQTLKRVLGQAVTVRDFDELAIPFRAVATDLTTGEAVILGDGSLVQAIRASMSVPGVFAPVIIDEVMLVDGGLAMSLPVEVAQSMGADVLIVVDITSPLFEREELDSVFRITQQMTHFLTRLNAERSLALVGDDDVVIVPELGDISAAHFDRQGEAIEIGEAAARAALGPLRALAARLGPMPPSARPVTELPVIDFIELVNQSPLHDKILRSRIRIRPGDALDLDELEKNLDAIYALEVFDLVRYDVVEDAERGTGLVITAEERHWGPNYMQFGMRLSSDFKSVNDFTLGAAYTRNAMNRLGADLRIAASVGRISALEVDFHQPLDTRAVWFTQPRVFVERERRDVFIGNFPLATVEIDRLGGALGFGRNFGNRVQLRTDLEISREGFEVVRGVVGDFDEREKIRELSAAALYDRLDNLDFPTRGSLVELRARRSIAALGSDHTWQQFELLGVNAFTLDRYTVMTRGRVGVSRDDDVLPFSRLYRLGGFGRLSGRAPDSLLDKQTAILSVSVQRRIGDIRLAPIYAGLSLETGNTWSQRDEMSFSDLRYGGSVYVGIDTLLGPAYLAAGLGDDGDRSVYFYLGNPFDLRRR